MREWVLVRNALGLTLAFSCAPSLVNAALFNEENTTPLSTLTTQNSRIELSGTLPSGLPVLSNRPIYFVVRFAGKKEYTSTTAIQSDGSYDDTVSLKYGPGNYSLEIQYSKMAGTVSVNGVNVPTYSSIELKTVSVQNSDLKDEDYLLPSSYIESDSTVIKALSEQIVTQAQASTDFAKAQAIHDWVASNIVYDYDELHAMQANQPTFTKTALDTLNARKGICQEYSELYAALSRAQGLPTKIISGSAYQDAGEDHAWNQVYVNGEWIIVDTTWDPGLPPLQKYFNPDAAVFAKDHTQKSIENN